MLKYLKKRSVIEDDQASRILQEKPTFGFSGYSSPPENYLYMEEVSKITSRILQNKKINVVYGSSDTGIDQIIEKCCKETNTCLVGITCPQYLKWVPDEENRPPILIKESKEDYAEKFTDLLDVLIITGGREHTFEQDYIKAIMKGKEVIVHNCMPSIPGIENGKIQNAASLLEKKLHFTTNENFETILNEINPGLFSS